MSFSNLSHLYPNTRFGNATIVCSICFMKNKRVFEKGEMGQAAEKWNKTWGEVGQMRLPWPAVKTAQCSGRPGSATAGPDRAR